MKKIISVFFATCLPVTILFAQHKAKSYTLSSPDGKTSVTIFTDDSLHFSIMRDNEVIVPDVAIGMDLSNMKLGEDKIIKAKKTSVNAVIDPVVDIKNNHIPDDYNQLDLHFKNNYSLIFRAYNDAIAYRFQTNFPDSIIVKNEICSVQMPEGTQAFFQWAPRWMNSYEHLYFKEPLNSITSDTTTQLPLLIKTPDDKDVLFTESDLYDYPGMYFTGNGTYTLSAIYPPAVKTVRKNIPGQPNWDRDIIPETRYDYIAKTSGSRAFPWRIFALADKDYQLLDNEIVYKLADSLRLNDVSWIHPGQVAWDWWNDWNITGVDFKAGINTQTYEYYIDFASRNHIPYIIMDEGWYKLGDLMSIVPNINMPELISYAKQRHVGIILWCVWKTLDNQMQQAMDMFEKWGIKGVKVDFMNRDDQSVVDFYWRCAAMAANHHLMVDFHGAHKPTGIMRAYPNVVNFEGVPGLEQDKWTDSLTTPWMAVTLPYTRMFAGPMDYTPGAMRNAQLRDFRPINSNPMSEGTRCQQLAMYVLFDAPLQMLSDNPTTYEKEKECLDFITSVPTTWDETIPLDGKVGKYIVEARKKGNEYFVGAMTNWTPRDLKIDFSFLPPGEHHIIIFQDGVNADRNGTDYKRTEQTITNKDILTVHLAPGGGWAARID